MPCYHPMKAWYNDVPNSSGKCSLTWDIKVANTRRGFVEIPCGQCIGCRLERSRQWAIRCVHEASLYDRNCFITLTFNDDFLKSRLASGLSLVKSDFQKFMKRLRKRYGNGIRFFHCGEYGEKYGRPHHHACLFNFDFPDKVLWKVSNGVKYYTSEILSDLWPYGYCSIGDVSFESAAYVARYVVKKINGERAKEVYGVRVPEYITMSRRPGIAAGWFEKYKSDVYPDDKVVVRNGLICKPPKYYDKLMDRFDSDCMVALKEQRKEAAEKNPNNGYKRLRVREKVKLLKAAKLRRSYEAESI